MEIVISNYKVIEKCLLQSVKTSNLDGKNIITVLFDKGKQIEVARDHFLLWQQQKSKIIKIVPPPHPTLRYI